MTTPAGRSAPHDLGDLWTEERNAYAKKIMTYFEAQRNEAGQP